MARARAERTEGSPGMSLGTRLPRSCNRAKEKRCCASSWRECGTCCKRTERTYTAREGKLCPCRLKARWILRGGLCQASHAEACSAAHREHVIHTGHSRDIPSERLVVGLRRLPSEARHCEKWEARWSLRGGWLRASDAEVGGAAHGEHLVHASHARDIPRERLVESACRLPGEARRDGKWEARWILHGGYSVRQAVQRWHCAQRTYRPC